MSDKPVEKPKPVEVEPVRRPDGSVVRQPGVRLVHRPDGTARQIVKG